MPSDIDQRLGASRISGDGKRQIVGEAFSEISRAGQAEFPQGLSPFRSPPTAAPMLSNSPSPREVQAFPNGLKEIFLPLIRILC